MVWRNCALGVWPEKGFFKAVNEVVEPNERSTARRTEPEASKARDDIMHNRGTDSKPERQ